MKESKPVDVQFGMRLRELRKAKALTQKELAEKVGIDFTYLSKIETGNAAPPAEDTIRELAGVLGTDEEELILLAGKMPKDYKPTVAGILLRVHKDGEISDEDIQKIKAMLRAERDKRANEEDGR